MNAEFLHDEEMTDSPITEEELILSLLAGSARTVFRPSPPVSACDCGKRVDELFVLVGRLQEQIGELRRED